MKIGIITLIVFLAAASFTTARTDNIDLSVEMFPLSREIQQGETIIVYARMDTHEDEIADVIISYRIRNNEGLILFESLETVAVEKTAKVIENLRVPRTLSPGTYFVDVEFRHKDAVKLERRTFEIVGESVEISLGRSWLSVIIVVLFIFFILLLIQIRRINELSKFQRKM